MKDKVALVTGSSRGIGRAIAQRLAKEGALVVINYAGNADSAASAVAEIEASGGAAFAVQGDVSSVGEIEKFYSKLDAELTKRTGSDRFDILVNNAGIGVLKGFEDTTEEDFDRVFAVNVKGAFFITQMALPRLRDGGRIINISSGVSRRPSDNFAAYCLTKAAIDNLTLLLVDKLGKRNITVNAIAPGYTATDINAELLKNPEFSEKVSSRTALGRIGRVEDIANVAAFLASEDAGWVTGQYIEASGGLNM